MCNLAEGATKRATLNRDQRSLSLIIKLAIGKYGLSLMNVLNVMNVMRVMRVLNVLNVLSLLSLLCLLCLLCPTDKG